MTRYFVFWTCFQYETKTIMTMDKQTYSCTQVRTDEKLKTHSLVFKQNLFINFIDDIFAIVSFDNQCCFIDKQMNFYGITLGVHFFRPVYMCCLKL